MSTIFGSVPEAPADAIFGVKVKFDACKLSEKHLLSVGVYRTAEGKPYVFKSVSKAEERILNKFNKDYLPMNGDPKFVDSARELLWGEEILNKIGENIGSIQSCAGTGGLFMISSIAKHYLKVPKVLISNPMWPNHRSIFEGEGNEIGLYPWAKNCVLDLEGCISGLLSAPEGCLVLLQACAHNPSGVDPTPEQWKLILNAIDERKHIVAFDYAYMGYGSGDINIDSEVIRNYALNNHKFFVAYSFSKSMGLYGERVGCLHIVTDSKIEANNVISQCANVGRRSYSVCPQHGSYIVTTVLNDLELRKEWLEELKIICKRIIDIREEFVQLLENKTKQNFDYIRNQRGMFALTGLTVEEVKILGEIEGVFIPNNGRISVPALNPSNVEFIAQAVANVFLRRK